MCAALVGGMDRLKEDYQQTARNLGFRLKVFTGKEKNIRTMIGSPDVIIIFTDKCSHKARTEAVQRAKAASIPVLRMHSSGVTSLKGCLDSFAARRT